MTHPADELLGTLSERQRDEVVAAWAAVEYGREPVEEIGFAALRDPALRETLRAVLHRTGRDLVRVSGRLWTSGFSDAAREELVARGWGALPEYDRAVLTTILVHSVAIPRSEGHLTDDSWASAVPTTVAELRSHTQLARGKLNEALQRLRTADLIRTVRSGENGAAYVPGAQFHRLTPAARRLLQEELVLAAGPGSPLAAAIRASRGER
ncbi:hypothetical protein [Cryptosporangium aurantiacum]|uniref:DprA winged helix domain-containing protein n=1 Tax=Cryptosporangium aurantiacum TaxID=134849 RepID=A0A1M7RI65_9ACTN|nr:hypothetical protein [Cryptosporangium aurantiacum]SHN45849.1 hypothetical protein SAMN05443668_11342 [Cryptosporangium aurantiacum]